MSPSPKTGVMSPVSCNKEASSSGWYCQDGGGRLSLIGLILYVTVAGNTSRYVT